MAAPQRLRLKTYKNTYLNDASVHDTAILDQYGRHFEYNGETKDHEPTGLSGSANH